MKDVDCSDGIPKQMAADINALMDGYEIVGDPGFELYRETTALVNYLKSQWIPTTVRDSKRVAEVPVEVLDRFSLALDAYARATRQPVPVLKCDSPAAAEALAASVNPPGPAVRVGQGDYETAWPPQMDAAYNVGFAHAIFKAKAAVRKLLGFGAQADAAGAALTKIGDEHTARGGRGR